MKLIFQQEGNSNLPHPVYLLCVFRDERLLLDYFVKYYCSLGITHFIMIDNLSDDDGPEFLQSLQNINLSLYRTAGSYKNADFGTQWVNQLLEKHCRNQYCLVVDVDELFVFDSSKYDSLHSLIGDMEASESNVVPATLLDMYPEKTNDSYREGRDFLSHSLFFDELNAEFYEEWGTTYGKYSHKVGGVRKRVLGTTVCIHKFPLFKYDFFPIGVAPGCHFFQSEGEILRESNRIRVHQPPGVLLHFKFIKPHFKKFIEKRIENNEDWNNSEEYRSYRKLLDHQSEVCFFDRGYSKTLNSTGDLSRFFQWWVRD